MATRKVRPYGRQNQGNTRTTGVIKTGWKKKGQKGEYPGKLSGFLPCLGMVNPTTKKNQLCDSVLLAYGFSPDKIRDNLNNYEVNKDFGFDLPQKLVVVINYDLSKNPDGEWDFRGVFQDGYEYRDEFGVACSGDGDTAKRSKYYPGKPGSISDLQKKIIPCRPVGVPLGDNEIHCEISAAGLCKSRGSIAFRVASPNGDPLPFPDSEILFKLETGSDFSLSQFLEEISLAADRLEVNGRAELSGIRGLLTYQTERTQRRCPETFRLIPTTVGRVILTLSEADIRYRLNGKSNELVIAPPTEPLQIGNDDINPTNNEIDPDIALVEALNQELFHWDSSDILELLGVMTPNSLLIFKDDPENQSRHLKAMEHGANCLKKARERNGND